MEIPSIPDTPGDIAGKIAMALAQNIRPWDSAAMMTRAVDTIKTVIRREYEKPPGKEDTPK